MKRAGLALLVIGAVAVATPARAQQPDDTGASAPTPTPPDAALAEAQKAFAAGDFDAALAAIASGLASDAKSLQLLWLRADILLARRDFEGALAAYEAYLAARPRGANRRKVRKIIGNLAAVRTTLLKVTVDPGPAQVFLDSKTLGVYCEAAPTCQKGIFPGRYQLIIEGPGFEPARQRAVVTLGQTTEIAVSLTEKPSQLTVEVIPADAQVVIDGGAAASGRQSVELPAGEHTVDVSLDGFVAASQTVTLTRGNPGVVELALAELVPVTVSVPDANLTLDGAPVTLTDGGAIAIASDGQDHVLTATAQGYQDATVTISKDRSRGTGVEVILETIAEKPVDIEKPATPPPVTSSGWSSNRKILFFSLGAVGAVGLGLGTFFGLEAKTKNDDSDEFCDDDDNCAPAGAELRDDALSNANFSNVAFAVGLAAVVGAGVVWFTAPDGVAESPSVSASVSPDAVGISVRLGF